MTREELRAKHEQLFKFDSGSGPGKVEDSSVIVELLDENGKLRAQLAEALKCPQESWECAKEIRTLTKEREALRTWNQQLIASEALARTQLALAERKLERALEELRDNCWCGPLKLDLSKCCDIGIALSEIAAMDKIKD